MQHNSYNARVKRPQSLDDVDDEYTMSTTTNSDETDQDESLAGDKDDHYHSTGRNGVTGSGRSKWTLANVFLYTLSLPSAPSHPQCADHISSRCAPRHVPFAMCPSPCARLDVPLRRVPLTVRGDHPHSPACASPHVPLPMCLWAINKCRDDRGRPGSWSLPFKRAPLQRSS